MRIGVTGKNCSGKDTVAELLIEKGFYHFSLSDVIRDELAAREKDATRDNLTRTGNELREAGGPGVLAERTLDRLEPDRNYVITSIRNPGEVEVLRAAGDFVLFDVDAPSRVRYGRSVARARVEEGEQSFEAFLEKEEREQSSDPNRQQLDTVAAMAEITILNDGSLDDLRERLETALRNAMSTVSTERPSWDEYFMSIAVVVASRSNCIKRKVAAVIVKDRRIISTGYNGTPRGTRNCNEGGCPRCNNFAASGTALDECTCSHGEENAIVQAAYHGVCLKDSTIYTTFSPCLMCAKMIINAGIQEVVYNAGYPLADTASGLLLEAGIEVRQHALGRS